MMIQLLFDWTIYQGGLCGAQYLQTPMVSQGRIHCCFSNNAFPYKKQTNPHKISIQNKNYYYNLMLPERGASSISFFCFYIKSSSIKDADHFISNIYNSFDLIFRSVSMEITFGSLYTHPNRDKDG